MEVIIGERITIYKTYNTIININNIKYTYIEEDDIHYVTSSEQNSEIINNINILLSNIKNINVQKVINIINNYESNNHDLYINNIDDKFYIFQDNNISKCKLNKTKLWTNFNSNIEFIEKLSNYKIPKDLILSKKQFYNLILSEIEKVNLNMNYPHYIYCNNDNIMDLSFRFIYKGELENKMKYIFEKFGYNYFEINFKLSELYPFMPPEISYIKPKVEISLISSIYNLDIWDINSWNYIITFDWIINNLGKALEPLFNKYVDIDNISFNFIESNMIKLNHISKIKTDDLVIDFNVSKFTKSDEKKQNSIWKSGTGYGHGYIKSEWDISKYINIIKKKNDKIIELLGEINNYLISNNNENNNYQLIYNYILSIISGINLLNFNNNINIYKEFIELIDVISKKSTPCFDDFIKKFSENINNLISEMKILVNNNIGDEYICIYLYYIEIFDKYNSIKSSVINNENTGVIQEYINMVKSNIFDTIELDKSHRYYNKKDDILLPKTIIRVMSELTSLKNDLPVNWDSSVILRMVESNSNLISFIIVGPKDTPYHNGLFEFHAYFPEGYPNKIPQVNIHTTDNGKVRFNPNLYACGKVCLSLLGTWSGEKGESWIPEISTFFQVIISIQSLILVDNPYFNEPGYANGFNTDKGKKANAEYNDNIRYHTVRVAMIEMLKNKPESYNDFIEQHFKLKKDEIISTVQKWVDESSNKEKFNKVFDELKKLL
jgi:ubiquitin-protein ligase